MKRLKETVKWARRNELELVFVAFCIAAMTSYYAMVYRPAHSSQPKVFVLSLVVAGQNGGPKFLLSLSEAQAQCPPGQEDKNIRIDYMGLVPDMFAGTCGELWAAALDTVLASTEPTGGP
ncbi:MAG: hypothetical protein WC869_16525 [Phycisphaerae bacterium]